MRKRTTAAEQWGKLRETLQAHAIRAGGKFSPQQLEAVRIIFYGGVEFGMSELQGLAENIDAEGIKILCDEVAEGLKWKL